MMTSIYLVRHGQTAWNKEEIFRGRTDVPLDETGRRQAELVAEYFKGKEVHRIYSSPLSRAWETANKIAQLQNLNVEPLGEIVDLSFGDWEGHSHKEIKKTDEETYRMWREEPHRVKLPGGESLDDVRKRAMASLEEVIRNHFGENLILVSHRVVNKVLICGILGLDNSHFWQITQDTAAINLIQFKNGKYILSFMNETCHLKPLEKELVKVDF
ncbi:MAG: histidine phosphatase family protein [Syntrophaceae bacterium]|nr:histidine phosphatase family protein [Syntrophaceae bacterium]